MQQSNQKSATSQQIEEATVKQIEAYVNMLSTYNRISNRSEAKRNSRQSRQSQLYGSAVSTYISMYHYTSALSMLHAETTDKMLQDYAGFLYVDIDSESGAKRNRISKAERQLQKLALSALSTIEAQPASEAVHTLRFAVMYLRNVHYLYESISEAKTLVSWLPASKAEAEAKRIYISKAVETAGINSRYAIEVRSYATDYKQPVALRLLAGDYYNHYTATLSAYITIISKAEQR